MRFAFSAFFCSFKTKRLILRLSWGGNTLADDFFVDLSTSGAGCADTCVNEDTVGALRVELIVRKCKEEQGVLDPASDLKGARVNIDDTIVRYIFTDQTIVCAIAVRPMVSKTLRNRCISLKKAHSSNVVT